MLRLINDKYKKKEINNISFVLNYFSAKSKMGYGYEYGYSYGKYGDAYRQNGNFGLFSKIKRYIKDIAKWFNNQLEK